MSNDQFITVTRALVKRGWSDFEPKVISGLLTGSVAAFIVSLLAQYGVHLSTIQANYVVVGCYFLGSYATPSTGTTVTKNETTQGGTVTRQSETHSGNSVSVVTGPTPIQSVPAQPSAPSPVYGEFLSKLPSATGPTPIPEPDEPADQPTQVMYR